MVELGPGRRQDWLTRPLVDPGEPGADFTILGGTREVNSDNLHSRRRPGFLFRRLEDKIPPCVAHKCVAAQSSRKSKVRRQAILSVTTTGACAVFKIATTIQAAVTLVSVRACQRIELL